MTLSEAKQSLSRKRAQIAERIADLKAYGDENGLANAHALTVLEGRLGQLDLDAVLIDQIDVL